ncbi:hypothetical protein P7K49_034125 [Saguinus oedipus]|uniref:Upstream stimulatory factor 2 n=1 Tax=Saguinus oedipus TaxID=9490 RepID=A0ABQ9TTV4_SAGOE|nr:hypothetical protein P7K49_034125 [Saguinus oedipus]
MRLGPPSSRTAARPPGPRARAPPPLPAHPPLPTDLLYCLQSRAARLVPGDPRPCSGSPDVPSGPTFHPGGERRPRAPRNPGTARRAGGRAGWGRPRGVPEPRAARSRRAGGGGDGGGCSGCRSGGGCGCGGGISSSHDPTVCPRDQRERLPYLLRPLLPRGVSAGLGAPPAARPLPSLPPLPSPPPRAPRPPRPRPPHGHAGPGSGSRCLGHRCCRRQVRAPAGPCPPRPGPGPAACRPGRHDPERPRARLKMEAAGAGGTRHLASPDPGPSGAPGLRRHRAGLGPHSWADPRRRKASSCRKVSSCRAGRARGGLGAPGAALTVPRPSSAPGGDGPGAEEQTAVAITSVQQAAFGDHNIQYQFRTETNGGQVTYRVVQVTDGQLDGQGDTAGAVSVVSTAAFAGGQQAVTQVGVDGAAQRPGPAAASVPPGPAAPFPLAVIQNPFSNGGSPAAEAVSGEARFAYFPASSVGDTTAVSVQTTDQSLQAGGQFYVMMTPQDVLQTGTQRTIAPRTHPYSPKIDGTRTPRDERRRAQHNEGEDKVGLQASPTTTLTGSARPGVWSDREGGHSRPTLPQVLRRALLDAEKVENEQRRESTVSGVEGQGP